MPSVKSLYDPQSLDYLSDGCDLHFPYPSQFIEGGQLSLGGVPLSLTSELNKPFEILDLGFQFRHVLSHCP
jgi:hypothetical protein